MFIDFGLDRKKKNVSSRKHIGLRVAFNNAYRRVPSQPWRYSAVQCMLILVLINLMQLLENQHMDSYND